MSDPIVIQKAPSVTKDYEFTWNDAASDSITASTWTTAIGITIDADSFTNTTTILRLSDGTDGVNYQLTNSVTYASGQTDERVVNVEVRARVADISLLNAEVGDVDANSYVSLEDADAYFANRPFSDDWFEADTVLRERALMLATIQLDQYDFVGQVVDDTQALKWPRQLDDAGNLIRTYAVDVIPIPIINATCELALSIIQSAGSSATEGTISEIQIGKSATAKFVTGSTVVEASIDYTGLPVTVARYLKGLRLYSVVA